MYYRCSDDVVLETTVLVSIRLEDKIKSLCLGLEKNLVYIICIIVMPLFCILSLLLVCQRLFQPTKPYAATSMHHLVDHLVTH